MADKYADHGAYTSAAVTGSISGSVLTITAVASGVVCVGGRVNLPGVLDGMSIMSLGTGTGGTGTYNVSRSQTLGSVSGTIDAGYPQNTPTWGSAQEGDGTATGTATSATVSVDFSGGTATAGNTLSIMGATLTCVASGAGANQFNAGTGTTLIDNIVDAINRTSNTVTIAAQATGWATPKLQDAVFARRAGNNLEIMTRAGSAQYNSSSFTHSGISGVSGAPWSFSGGAGGAWGHLVNATYTSTGGLIWPSGQGFCAYGVLVGTKPHAGVINAGDDVYMRGKRAIAMYYCTVGLNIRSAGVDGNPVRFIADNGTKWADTNPILDVLAHYWNNAGTFYVTMAQNVTETHELMGLYNSNGTRSLRLRCQDSALNFSLALAVGGPTRVATFDMDAPGGQKVSVTSTLINFNRGRCRARVEDAKVSTPLTNNTFFNTNSGVDYAIRFLNVQFDAAGSTAANSGGVLMMGNFGYNYDVEFVGCSFTNFVIGSELFVPNYIYLPSNGLVVFDACDFGSVTKRGPYYATLPHGIVRADARNQCMSIVQRSGTRDFCLDSVFGLVEWNAQQSQPCCNALLDDGTTKWSIKMLPTIYSAQMCEGNPLKSPRLTKVNSLANGARTITLEFVAEQGITPTKAMISMEIMYEATDGTIQVVDTTRNPNATLSASTVTWTNYSGGFVTFVNGGTVNHNRWKLEITTPAAKPIATGKEIGVVVSIRSYSTNATKTFFIDPDFTVA